METPLPQANPVYLTSITINTIPKAIRSSGVEVWFKIRSTVGRGMEYT